jgi:SPP1 family predicted phage head-tail adaptor
MACKGRNKKKCFNFARMADKRVIIQTPTLVEDDYGGQSVTWGNTYTVWAYIKSSTGREVFDSEQMESRVSHTFTIRYNSALKDTAETGKYRISFDGRLFEVRYIRNLEADLKSEGSTYQMLYADENVGGIE